MLLVTASPRHPVLQLNLECPRATSEQPRVSPLLPVRSLTQEARLPS